ncbi:MAG: helix-turn-helix transcriptional regulator [Mollicutes bacterium]|nr:helix-turn-helix transcriptional regulator [Mollicutes bacterium]MDD7264389.1 helix-turn-helix transcriptional regulator [bacterium]MDY4979081.1 helix-turn-helix transcriptional regulator [Candidatus Onthovivens sp.]
MKNKIKELRLNKGVTQKELAKLVNKSIQSVLNWESGLTEISIKDAIILADYFDVSLDELFYHQNKESIQSKKNIIEEYLKFSIDKYLEEYIDTYKIKK